MADYRETNGWTLSFRLLGTLTVLASAFSLGHLSTEEGPRDGNFALLAALTVLSLLAGVLLIISPDIRRRLKAARATRSQEAI